MKQPPEERKKFKPVKVIGKQPGEDVWVFNQDVQMDQNGHIIAVANRTFILESKKHDFLVNVTQDLDDGEALKELIQAEKDLFGNNYPQVVMAHAVSSLAANFDLVIETFDGCGIPVLVGHPVSGKSTALKAVLSVFGDNTLINSVTKKYIERRQSATTIPFGWDDVSDPKMLGEVAVSSFNQAGSATMRGENKPHTVPMVTTNLDSKHLKVKSRWFRIQFEEISPKYKGEERWRKEVALRKAMSNARRSISVVTSYIHNCLVDLSTSANEYDEVERIVEDASKASAASDIDHRAQRQFTLMLFCCKKILGAVNLEAEFEVVKQKLETVILPSYSRASSDDTTHPGRHGKKEKVEVLLKEEMPKAILAGNKEEILSFFDQDFVPQKCGCGEAMTFHVGSLLTYLKNRECESAKGVTDNSLRYHIKTYEIGCVGRQVQFRNSCKQVSAAHVRRDWFHPEDVEALDARFGKRNKKVSGRGDKNNYAPPSEAAHGNDARDKNNYAPPSETAHGNDAPNDIQELGHGNVDGDKNNYTPPSEASHGNDASNDIQELGHGNVDGDKNNYASPSEATHGNDAPNDIQELGHGNVDGDKNNYAPPSEAAHGNDAPNDIQELGHGNVDANDIQELGHGNVDGHSTCEEQNIREKMAFDKELETSLKINKNGKKRSATKKLQDAWNDGKGVAGKRSRKQTRL